MAITEQECRETHRQVDQHVSTLYDRVNARVPWSVFLTIALVVLGMIGTLFLSTWSWYDSARVERTDLWIQTTALKEQMESVNKTLNRLETTLNEVNLYLRPTSSKSSRPTKSSSCEMENHPPLFRKGESNGIGELDG